MSTESSAVFTCAKCQRETAFPIRNTVDAGKHPELRQAVRNGSLFHAACPYCGETMDLDYGFLYRQPEGHLAIRYVPPDSLFDDAPPKDPGCVYRIVRTRTQLLEKLTIADAGLDDKIVELMKLLAVTKVKYEDTGIINVSCTLVSRGQKQTLAFEIISESGAVHYVDFDQDLYERLDLGYLGKQTRLPFADSAVIDSKWAIRLVSGR